jgi:ribosome biogenesis GTPase / thiamine phosphate phosphatase
VARTHDGLFHKCRIKGKFKIDKQITSSNPIAVGDVVDISIEDDEENSTMIYAIDQRKNYLVRTSPHNKHQKHIVASNLDQSIIIATIKDPRTSTGFIDRYLVSCEVYHIPAIIVMNKCDMMNDEDETYFVEIKRMYEAAGYPVYLISAEKKIRLVQIHELLKNKITLFTGHSGVGKSTLVNQLIPEKNITVQEVSDWSGKGMHTTTFAEMHDLPFGGKIIDTPGIRELGIVNVTRVELGGYFPEIRQAALACKYNNCLHIHEPECAVREAIDAGNLHPERYLNYRKIFETIDDRTY